MGKRFIKGFTLIELMIVVAVIAILASLAYYNYNKYGFRARRVDGRELLLRVAAAQERFFTNFNGYAPDITSAPPAGLGFTSDVSEKEFYVVTTAVGITGDNQSYVLVATPQNGQASDVCDALTITSMGQKSQTGTDGENGSCW